MDLLAHVDGVMESSHAPLPGQIWAVFFEDDTYWHERLLLWRLSENVWFVLTPDLDLYPEDWSLVGGDGPSKIKLKGEDFRWWSRVGGSSYRFADPIASDQQLRSYIKQAYKEGLTVEGFDPDWRPSHVVDTNGVVQEAGEFLKDLLITHRLTKKGPGHRAGLGLRDEARLSPGQEEDINSVKPIVPAGGNQVWIITENVEEFKVGDTANVKFDRDLMIGGHTGLIKTATGWVKAELVGIGEAVEVADARRGVVSSKAVPAGGDVGLDKGPGDPEAAEDGATDARCLVVDYDNQGVRFKDWRTLASEIRDYGYEDWPFDGPATVVHMVKHMQKFGGDPKQWLELWCRQKGIADQDRVKHELRSLMDVLHLGGTYDQLNLPILASFETVARRVQCIVDAYAAGGSSPDWGNAKLFTGYVGPDDLVMPQLRSWAARRGKEEVELYQARSRMKELKKHSTAVEEAAGSVADGSVAAGGPAKPKRRPRGKGLEPPAAGQ